MENNSGRGTITYEGSGVKENRKHTTDQTFSRGQKCAKVLLRRVCHTAEFGLYLKEEKNL